MDERDKKYVQEQLKCLDAHGSASQAISADHRDHHHQTSKAGSASWSANGDSFLSSNSGPLKSFQPRGTVEFPLKFDKNGRLLVQSNAVRTALSCNIPGERWNAKFSGSSLVRGPMGSATGSMLLSYNIAPPRRLQAVSQLAIGDQANLMVGAIHHTTTAWYGIGMFYYPNNAHTKGSVKHAFQIQSQQRLEKGNMTIKFFVPTHTMQPNTTLSVHHKQSGGQLELGMTRSQPHVTLVVSPKISAHRQLRLSCQWRKRKGIKLDASLNQSLGGKKTNSSNSSLGIGVRRDAQCGLSWVFTWIRGDVVIKIPIFILSHADPLRYVCSCYLAFTSYLIQEVIAEMWNLSSSTDNSASLRSVTWNARAKAREDAAKQKCLMQKQADSRRATETKKVGLVITKAVYFAPRGDKWDVTTQLQFWTNRSSLNLPALSKQNLLGFYNVAASSPPSIGSSNSQTDPWWHQLYTAATGGSEKKRLSRLDRKMPKDPLLSVQYDYNGESFEITVKDEDPLSLPSNKARKVLAEPGRKS